MLLSIKEPQLRKLFGVLIMLDVLVLLAGCGGGNSGTNGTGGSGHGTPPSMAGSWEMVEPPTDGSKTQWIFETNLVQNSSTGAIVSIPGQTVVFSIDFTNIAAGVDFSTCLPGPESISATEQWDNAFQGWGISGTIDTGPTEVFNFQGDFGSPGFRAKFSPASSNSAGCQKSGTFDAGPVTPPSGVVTGNIISPISGVTESVSFRITLNAGGGVVMTGNGSVDGLMPFSGTVIGNLFVLQDTSGHKLFAWFETGPNQLWLIAPNGTVYGWVS